MDRNDKKAGIITLIMLTGAFLFLRFCWKTLNGDYKEKEPSFSEIIDSANARNARNYDPKKDSSRYYNNNPTTSRQDRILRQFNVGSGAHRNLERYIKENMHDPSSYKHIESSYSDKKKYLIVQTKFRGKNAYGALVVNSITAKVSLDGEVLEIIDKE